MNEANEIKEENYFFFMGLVIGALTFLYQNIFLLVLFVAFGIVDFFLGFYLTHRWKVPIKRWSLKGLDKERHAIRKKTGGAAYLLFFNLTLGLLIGVVAGVFIGYFFLVA
jgi:ABC-type phosphate transport system permease subunit